MQGYMQCLSLHLHINAHLVTKEPSSMIFSKNLRYGTWAISRKLNNITIQVRDVH